MLRNNDRLSRLFAGTVCRLAAVAAVGWLLWGAAAYAVDPVFVKVEEDWELVVSQPDASLVAPQVTCVISPNANLEPFYAAFELNHQSQTSFTGGGLTLIAWNNETPVAVRRHTSTALLSQAQETVCWTVRMKTYGSYVSFRVKDGTSTTWGDFGGDDLVSLVQYAVADLNAYSPDVSVANSGVGYAGNRVTSLVLKQVRRYTADGQVFVDDTPRVVHPQN